MTKNKRSALSIALNKHANLAHAYLPREPQPITFDSVQALIVTIVAEAGETPITGYELVKRSDGALNINSIYPQIDRLVALGVLKSEYESSPPGAKPKLPRRLISLSDEGTLMFSHAQLVTAYDRRELQPPPAQSPGFSIPDLPGTPHRNPKTI